MFGGRVTGGTGVLCMVVRVYAMSVLGDTLGSFNTWSCDRGCDTLACVLH